MTTHRVVICPVRTVCVDQWMPGEIRVKAVLRGAFVDDHTVFALPVASRRRYAPLS